MTNNNNSNNGNVKKEEWEVFLTEASDVVDPDDKEKNYIQPNIELKLPPNKRKECRDILLEIKNFGVSQRQMLYLIYLMSLELEDTATMKAITKAIGENRENTPVSEICSQKDKGKIIL